MFSSKSRAARERASAERSGSAPRLYCLLSGPPSLRLMRDAPAVSLCGPPVPSPEADPARPSRLISPCEGSGAGVRDRHGRRTRGVAGGHKFERLGRCTVAACRDGAWLRNANMLRNTMNATECNTRDKSEHNATAAMAAIGKLPGASWGSPGLVPGAEFQPTHKNLTRGLKTHSQKPHQRPGRAPRTALGRLSGDSWGLLGPPRACPGRKIPTHA